MPDSDIDRPGWVGYRAPTDLICGACGTAFPWVDATAVHTSEGLLPICPSCMSLANR